MVLENIKLLTKMLIFDIVYTIKYNLYFKKKSETNSTDTNLTTCCLAVFPCVPRRAPAHVSPRLVCTRSVLARVVPACRSWLLKQQNNYRHSFLHLFIGIIKLSNQPREKLSMWQQTGLTCLLCRQYPYSIWQPWIDKQ